MTLTKPVAAAAPPSAGPSRRATRDARPRALPSRLGARNATRRDRGACPALSESFVAAAASAERDAGDASTSASAGALSIVDSTEDVFAAFCESQVELVARALGRGARCMLYLRSPGTAGDSLQLEEVASFPPPRDGTTTARASATATAPCRSSPLPVSAPPPPPSPTPWASPRRAPRSPRSVAEASPSPEAAPWTTPTAP